MVILSSVFPTGMLRAKGVEDDSGICLEWTVHLVEPVPSRFGAMCQGEPVVGVFCGYVE